MAAGVAALSVLWLRAQAPLTVTPLAAQRLPATPSAAPGAVALKAVDAGAASYVMPPAPSVRPMLVPSTQLANYVVAHSDVFLAGDPAQPALLVHRERAGTAAEAPRADRQVDVQSQCAVASESLALALALSRRRQRAGGGAGASGSSA